MNPPPLVPSPHASHHSPSSQSSFDVIVLGLGAMGSAAAWAAARRGAKVCAIEQYGVAHALGSSHGDVRIIRKAYFEHPDYVPLLHEAYTRWRVLEAEAGFPLQVTSGLLACGPGGSETIRGLKACYAQHELPHERLPNASLRERFPFFSFPSQHEGFLDPAGGYLFAEKCVEQFVRQAQILGADIRLNETVREWRADRGQVEVVTDTLTVRGGALVLAGGPWSNEALLRTNLPLQVVRKVQLWYRFPGMETCVPPEVPAFYFDLPYGAIYGFPVYGPDGMKVACHTGGEPVAGPESVCRELRAADEGPLLHFFRDVFPGVTFRRSRYSVCMYTNTPDGNFVLDLHPEQERVCLAAGFSGHGFKFAPVVGEIMADLALEGKTVHPIDFLRAARFLGETLKPGE
ncbi:MAG: N-methyl-L-tryptophan oxidase [Candidatus Hydrogenedentes bacterium]|nr:N-methyl-L-tryptophan oxidase [Candidatus Hydrogenedentota bacterium]